MSQQLDSRPVLSQRPADRAELPGFPWILMPHNLGLLLGKLLLFIGRRLRTAARYLKQRPLRVLAVVGIVAFLYALTVVVGSNALPRNTQVLGVDVGGMSQDEATATLTQSWQARTAETVTVEGIGASTSLPLASVEFDVATTVSDAAMSRWQPWDLVTAVFGGGPTDAQLVVDPDALTKTIETLSMASDESAREPVITYDGLTPVSQAGRAGLAINPQSANTAITSAINDAVTVVTLPSYFTEPTVNQNEIDATMRRAAVTAVSSPITVKLPQGSVEISPDLLAANLTFVGQNRVMVPVVNGSRMVPELDKNAPGAVPLTPAVYSVKDGNPQVTPSQPGLGLNPSQLSAEIAKIIGHASGGRTITMELSESVPADIPQNLVDRGVTTQVSVFTQEFEAAEYRRINIGQAAQRLNGTVIEPGAVFSMNDTVGERTVENGYTEGVVVGEGGVLTKDMGGGVSAATTTVWVAAFMAGLEKVEQSAHTIYISRYIPGLEATVSWGNIDLKFRNNSDAPIYITANTTDTSVTVSMFGTPRYDLVQAEIGDKLNFTEPGVTSASGPQCLPAGGTRGFDITVTRLLFVGDEQVAAQPFNTHYSASPAVRCTS